MNDANILEVTDLKGFVEAVKLINNEFKLIWFRGHENASYSLTPSIFREPFSCENETDFLLHFKSKSIPYLSRNFRAENDFEWFFIMQHFGMPTRLLDWTTSAITALAFAIFFRDDQSDTGKHYGKDVDVWCLNPLKLNDLANIDTKNKIPSISADAQIQTVYKTGSKIPQYPVAIFGPLNNERILAQKGVFTLYPYSDVQPKLQEDIRANDFLKKISIKGQDNITSLKKELSVIGMSETSLYPDLNHLSLELRRELVQKI
jgi:hypothetical protein